MIKSTLTSIAERTGFSISTVSRTLNGKSSKYRISDKTAKIIKLEAEKLGYTPNLAAQSLRTKRTNTIGLLVPSIDNPFFSNIANVIIQEALRLGYIVILANSVESEKNETAGINSLLNRNIDGLIIVPSGNNPSRIEEISKLIPTILVDRYYPNSHLPYVSTDNYKGAYDATSFLIESGHKRIHCIQGPPNSITTTERVRGYMDALKQNNLEKEAMISGFEFSIQSGYIETKFALNSPNKPTAIFALSNTILLGALKAIKESELKVPGDISILSFDSNTHLDFLSPAITRVKQPVEEIGILSVKLLVDMIKNNSDNSISKQILIPPEIIIRDSVAKTNSRYN